MKNIVKISKKEGKELFLYFDASLEITNVTQKIFGANKYRVSFLNSFKYVFTISGNFLFGAIGFIAFFIPF